MGEKKASCEYGTFLNNNIFRVSLEWKAVVFSKKKKRKQKKRIYTCELAIEIFRSRYIFCQESDSSSF